MPSVKKPMLFCVDTSAWMDGWQRHYPPDVFPSLWLRLEERIAAGHIICSEEVMLSLRKKPMTFTSGSKAVKKCFCR